MLSSSSVNQPTSRVLTVPTKFAYGVGHVFNDLCASMWFLYFTVYFQLVLQFPPALCGGLMLIGQVVDGIATPLVGYESDMTKGFGSYGRRKTWHIVGTLLVLFSFPFIFNPCFFAPDAPPWAQSFYFAPLIAIFQIGWAATQISHLALMPELTHCKHDRVLLNSLRYFFTVFSNIFVLVIAYFLLKYHDATETTDVPSTHGRNQTVAMMSSPRYVWHVGPLLWSPKATPASEDPSPMSNTTSTILGPKDQVVFSYISFIVVGAGCLFTLIFHVAVKEQNVVYNKRRRGEGDASSSYQPTDGRSQHDPLLDSEDPALSHSYGSFSIPPAPDGPLTVSQQSEDSLRNISSLPTIGASSEDHPMEEEMRWSDWLKEPQFYLVNVLHMSTRLIVNGSQVYISYYLIHTVQTLPKEYIALMPLVLYISSMLASTIQKQFQAFVGRKKSFLFGILIVVAYSLMVQLMHYPGPPTYQVFIVITLLGVGSASLLIGVLAMCNDLIATNTESGAFVYGAMSFTDKMSNGIMVQIVQLYQGQFTNDCINTYFFRDVQTYLCGCFALVALVILGILSPMQLGERWRHRNRVIQINASM